MTLISQHIERTTYCIIDCGKSICSCKPMPKTKQYETKKLKHNDLFTNYSSFMVLEGQLGLPGDVQKLYDLLHNKGLEIWSIEKIFEFPERIKAIPFLNPDVLIFQTTLMSRDKIDQIITYLEGVNWRPKEIWQLIRQDIPIVNSDKYDIFSFYVDEGQIILKKL